MKKPNVKNLKENKSQTKKIRAALSKESVKITINIDAEVLAKFRNLAEESGVPYQRLINRTLAENTARNTSLEARMKRLEKELKSLKKELIA